MSLDPERTANMIVCKDYWMSRRATESYRLCDKCPVQRLVIKLAALSTVMTRKSKAVGTNTRHFPGNLLRRKQIGSATWTDVTPRRDTVFP